MECTVSNGVLADIDNKRLKNTQYYSSWKVWPIFDIIVYKECNYYDQDKKQQ